MMSRRVLAWNALVLAAGVLPAEAGDYRYLYQPYTGHWHAVRHSVYELENRIAILEADPEIDDAYKGPIIARARADIRRLNVTLHPPRWWWAAPCCYSRKPIHLR